ncbi:LLM class flavin-dependent oxidoreductase [Acrocarpospora catenulata]|uniref:LLM class flavin-dependent oxidoreductase n=1 Tax=Acrocarpospora catenulata TaxID=2836182 RepID=UPI0020239B07|nr:LLM class flavin-dependent oxidoreductase [Acrocarpospora catenulata]
MTRPILVNGFKAAMVTHTSAGLWRHPDSRARRYRELDFWIETARTLERFDFDALFIADSLGAADVYQNSPDQALREGLQTPSADPSLAISAMAAVTERLGFGLTLNTSFNRPYELARRLSTLDHFTDGRIGWNVVTGLVPSAMAGLGIDPAVSHDERYDIAEEFMEVVYRLWEGSWADDAVIADVASGVYVEPRRVRPIEHHGRYFDVTGIHLAEPSPQRTPLIFQAGSSARGKRFSARHAEVVFVSAQRPDVLRRTVDDIRAQAAEAGRDPGSLRFISTLTVVTGETEREAQAKHEEYLRLTSVEGNLARLASTIQVDFGAVDLDEPLEFAETPGIQSVLANFTKLDPSRRWTPRQVAEYMALAGFGPFVVGSPAQVADELERWCEQAGIDGFNLVDIIPGQSFREFGELVMPELVARGRRPDPASGKTGLTLRERIFGGGMARVRDDHPAARHRYPDDDAIG